jgi:RNA polymerase sigma-70 factor, ECF subfamily
MWGGHPDAAMSMLHTHTSVSFETARGPREASDAELARALIAGQAGAIAETWRRFAPAVIMFARRALGSQFEAEDLTQEVFQRVFAKAKTLRAPDALRSFVFSFAIRLLRTELRRKRARAWLSFRRPETLVDLSGEAADIESRDLMRRFYALLDRLAPRHRLVFTLRHLESMTLEEVGVQMQLSLSTVKRCLEHATTKLSLWIETDAEMAALRDEYTWPATPHL